MQNLLIVEKFAEILTASRDSSTSLQSIKRGSVNMSR